MQRTEIISLSDIPILVTAVFNGNPIIYEAYSVLEKELRTYSQEQDLIDYIELNKSSEKGSVYLAIHYPDTLGQVNKKKIDLNPEKCSGATFRYTVEGWGLIHMQLDSFEDNKLNCRFAVNSEKRAEKWANTNSDQGMPNLWDWKAVEKHARRLIRTLRQCAE